MLVTTFAYGLLLDANPYSYVYVFPIISVLGITSVYLLSLIKYDPDEALTPSSGFMKSIGYSLKGMYVVLKGNKPYLHFEIAFMLYGFAFMVTYPVITIFFYEGLELNYTSVAFYRNAYNILAIILLPFAGKLLGNIDPRRFGILTFSSLFFYVFFLILTRIFPGYFEVWKIKVYYLLVFYIIFHGVFAATMVLLWNIGSAYFAPANQAGTYQSIHLSLTGFRSIFAPLLGVLFYELAGFTITFSIGLLSVTAGMALLYWSYRNDRGNLTKTL